MSIKSLFENIADAIKDKNPNITNVTPVEMPSAIRSIPSGSSTAGGVTYDNTASGLTANNVQDAIDELAEDVSSINSDLSELNTITTINLGGGATLRVCGKIVELDLNNALATYGTWNTICTIPQAYRPPNNIADVIYTGIIADLSEVEGARVVIYSATGNVDLIYVGKTSRTGDWMIGYNSYTWLLS